MLLSFQVNTALSNFCKVVSILETPIPTNSSTLALKPDPFVSVLSKTVRSPTLYPSPPNTILYCTALSPVVLTIVPLAPVPEAAVKETLSPD